MRSSTFRNVFGSFFAAVLVFFLLTAHAEEALPKGEWEVNFVNGVLQTVKIDSEGNVSVTEKERTAKGKAVLKDGVIEIRYEDDRIEIWSNSSGNNQFTVQHWHPISAMEKRMPTLGSAAKGNVAPAKLKVHEWGTFTVLQGSTGRAIDWYQAPAKLVDLPPFVKRSFYFGGKSGTRSLGGMDTVRMETPVLYFYPEKAMDVTVTADFPNGRITEIFPPAVWPNFSGPTTWHGSLLPPDSPELKKVPAAEGPKGRHYATAREVPDAWLFRNKKLSAGKNKVAPEIPIRTVKDPDPVEPIDHFIFYRGAGRPNFHQLYVRQGADSNQFAVDVYGKAIPKLFALQIKEGQTSWVELDQIEPTEYEEGKALNQRTITFPKPAGTTHEVARDLHSAMVESLHSEGLTRDESLAMVNTWDNLWFTEPGTRLLAILPKETADELVPLKISPAPTEIDRVFVARIEILTRDVEEKLTSILNAPAAKDGAELQSAADQLVGLQLGRYAAGGMERAADIIESRLRSRFAKLQEAAEEMKKLQAKSD